MLTLYSYFTLFGVADNNGYGLKVFAFLKLAGVSFRHESCFRRLEGAAQPAKAATLAAGRRQYR